MGQPKLLLPWGTTSIVGHLLRQWTAAGALQVCVVHSDQDHVLSNELDRLGVSLSCRVANNRPDADMFSSILCGAASDCWLPAISHCAIVLGDQPHLRSSTLSMLIEQGRRNPEKITQPIANGHRHHPVLLPMKMLRSLPKSGARTLREFLKSREVVGVECDDPGLDLDIDRPEDYRRALAIAGLSRG